MVSNDKGSLKSLHVFWTRNKDILLIVLVQVGMLKHDTISLPHWDRSEQSITPLFHCSDETGERGQLQRFLTL